MGAGVGGVTGTGGVGVGVGAGVGAGVTLGREPVTAFCREDITSSTYGTAMTATMPSAITTSTARNQNAAKIEREGSSSKLSGSAAMRVILA